MGYAANLKTILPATQNLAATPNRLAAFAFFYKKIHSSRKTGLTRAFAQAGLPKGLRKGLQQRTSADYVRICLRAWSSRLAVSIVPARAGIIWGSMDTAFNSELLNCLFTQEKSAPATAGDDSPHNFYSAFDGVVLLVRFSGVLSQAILQSFKPVLFASLTGNVEHIVMDMEKVTALSRSTLGVLVDFASSVLGRGKKMYLLAPAPFLLECLDALRLRGFFEILAEEEDLICILPEDEERMHVLLRAPLLQS